MARGRAKLHPNGLITYIPGVRSDGAPVSLARAWSGEKKGAPNCSDEEEAELDQLLTDAMDAGVDDGHGPNESKESPLPDSFCHVSTCKEGRAPIPSSLRGRHLTAELTVGDLLYLPASWFHEVISYGGDAGGHLALNLWMAPPRMGSSIDKPYEDGFWDGLYCSLEKAWRRQPQAADQNAPRQDDASRRPKSSRRPRGKARTLWTHRKQLPPRKRSARVRQRRP